MTNQGSNSELILRVSHDSDVMTFNANSDAMSKMKRELLMLKQKQWALHKERGVALRRDKESATTIRAFRIKLRDIMQELQDRKHQDAATNNLQLHRHYDEDVGDGRLVDMNEQLARIAEKAALEASRSGRSF